MLREVRPTSRYTNTDTVEPPTTATLGKEESGHCREVETRVNVLDCEQSLFYFRFSESSARARKWRNGEPRETRVPLSSRAVRHALGHLRVSRVLLD